jgi:hypothetical protein
MPKTQTLTVTLMPDAYAPFYRFWGTDRPGQNPNVWAPTGLGQLVLEPGKVITGRLLDLGGLPMAGQNVIAQGESHLHERMATTQTDGSFQFAPLAADNYTIFAESQNTGGGIDISDRARAHGVQPIRPAQLFVQKDQNPIAVELRELPSVSVEVRYVDSQGRQTRGGFATLGGTIPSEPGKANGRAFGAAVKGLAHGEPQPQGQNQQMVWGRQLLADAEGRIRFRVPKGLRSTEAA